MSETHLRGITPSDQLIVDATSGKILGINTGGVASPLAGFPRTAAQLAAAPTSADIAMGDSVEFYDAADPTLKYKMNAGHTAFVGTSVADSTTLAAELAAMGVSPGVGRKGRAFKGNYGRRIALWSGASLQNSAGTAELLTTSDLPPIQDYATKVLKLTNNATPSFGQQVCETADYTSPTAAIEGIGIWAKNPGTTSLGCRIEIFNAAANHSTIWNLSVDPCDWTFLTISPKSNTGGTFVWGTDAIHFVRVTQRNEGGTWGASDYAYFGALYVGTRGRPRFIICNDDCASTVYHPFNDTSAMPTSGRSFREIVEHYGFKGTLYCAPSLIGTAGYLTQRELLEMQDIGWSIGSHSYTHPAYSNRGLTSLGPVGYADANDTYHSVATNDDVTIYNDIERGITELAALGIRNADNLFALPQGSWDAYVRSAVMRSRVKHVRAISSYNNWHTIAIGLPTGGGNTGATVSPGGWIHQGDAVQTDGTPTSGNVQTYIDDCVTYGATGANYHHAMSVANGAVLDAMCSYLKTLADAGTIEVLTMEQAAYDDGYI